MRIRPNYYLRRWKQLEVNRNRLNIDEINRAKVLFNTLNKLSEDDINILKVKYYDGEKLTNFDQNRNIYCCVEHITDQLVADGLGLSIRDYQN